MGKKSFFVVTETIVNFKRKSVDTFIKGISEELDGAHAILTFSKETLIKKDGFDESLVSDFKWGWAYESECCTIKDEILIKFV